MTFGVGDGVGEGEAVAVGVEFGAGSCTAGATVVAQKDPV